MKVYTFTVYLYLIFGLYFIYDSITKYIDNKDYKISIVFAVLAIFMFFFRLRSIKKIEERQKNNNR